MPIKEGSDGKDLKCEDAMEKIDGCLRQGKHSFEVAAEVAAVISKYRFKEAREVVAILRLVKPLFNPAFLHLPAHSSILNILIKGTIETGHEDSNELSELMESACWPLHSFLSDVEKYELELIAK